MAKQTKEKAREIKFIEKKREEEEEKKRHEITGASVEKAPKKEQQVKKKEDTKEKEKTDEKPLEEKKQKEIEVKKKTKKKTEKIENICLSKKGEKKESVVKLKKPRFFRQEIAKKGSLKDSSWRKPRGIDSKKQEKKRGKGKVPKIGYKKTKKIRHLVRGFRAELIHNQRELKDLIANPKEEAAIISQTVGRRKRNEIIKEANKLKITILNPRKGEI